jgi:hypothetical protein
MRHDPGLAASPRVRYKLKVGGMRILSSPEPRTQLRGEKVFILFGKVCSNVVWSTAALKEFAAAPGTCPLSLNIRPSP